MGSSSPISTGSPPRPVADRAQAGGATAPAGAASGRSRSRRTVKRTAAAMSAARNRPFRPPRNAIRRSRCTPAGVTTATLTAVSPPRSRVRTARPTSAPLSVRARSARPTSASVIETGEVSSASLGVAAGLPGAGSSPAARHRDQRRDLPTRPDLAGPQSPAERRESFADRVGPGRLPGRPDVPFQLRLHDGRDRRQPFGRRAVDAVLVRATDRGDADVDGLHPRVGGDLGVPFAEQGFAQELGHLRLADPHQPIGPTSRRRLPARSPSSAASPRPATSAASRAVDRGGPR